MREVTIFFLFSLFVTNCQIPNNKDRDKIVTFDLKKLPKVSTVRLSELGFVDIEYIPLETTEQSLIHRNFNMSNLGDRIIFGDKSFILKQANSILKFKNDGSFIAKIGTVGRGPDEFQVCNDMEVDEKGQIYIVDAWKKKFFVYSGSGEFIKTITFPLYGSVEYRYVESMFLCYNQNNLGNVENSFNLIDTGGKIIKSFPNKYPFKMYKDAYGYLHENLFYQFNNRLFKKEVYSDTIYAFENMTFKPHLVIDVGEKLITPKARSEFAGMDLAKNYITPRNLFEFGNYVYYEFSYNFVFPNSETYGFIGSKKNNSQVLIDPEQGIINDLDGGLNVFPLTIKDDNTIIGWVEAIKLKTHVASERFKNSNPKYPEKKQELERLANSLKETDNPVLMMVRLKK
ncbi:MAG: 6-bladed beta-propeller [Bacteroidales bacterium]|nr:6-bladed beta-propeller [Bacteroidales bacterium]